MIGLENPFWFSSLSNSPPLPGIERVNDLPPFDRLLLLSFVS